MAVKANDGVADTTSNEETTVTSNNTEVNEVSNTQIQNNDFGMPNKNGKSKKLLITIISLVVIGLAGIGGFIFYKFNSNPEAIMKDAINDAYKDFSKALEDFEKYDFNFNPLEDSFKMSGELSVGGDLLKGLENDKIKVEVGLDAKNEKFEASAILDENNKELLNATIFGKNGKLYLKSDNLFDNTYYINDYDFEENFDFSELESALGEMENISLEDIDSIVKSLKDAVIKSLDEDEMEKSKDEIKINGNKVKTTKITYTIDKKSTEKFVKSMIKEIKKDDSLLEKIAEIADEEVENIKDLLDEAEDEIDEDDIFSDMGKGKFSIYTTGLKQDVVRVELVAEGVTIAYNDYKDNFSFEVTSKDDDVNFEIVGETKKDITTIDVKYNKETYATFVVRSFTDSYIDLDYDINLPEDLVGTEIIAEGSIKLKVNKESDTEINGTFEFSLDANVDGEKINVSGKLDYALEIGANIADYSTTNAKEEMTEADAEKITNTIQSLQDTELFKFLGELDIDLDDLGLSNSYNEDEFDDLDDDNYDDLDFDDLD